MRDQDKTNQQLVAENEKLRRRVKELEAAETGRKQTEKALRESETRFRSLFQDASVGTMVVSPTGQFLQINRAFCEFLGYSEQELVGKTILSITHPDDQEENSKAIYQAACSGLRIQRLEKRYLHKSGRVLWGEVSSTLLCDAEGKPSYFIAQVLDVGERKRAEEALQKARDELEPRVEERTAKLEKAHEELDIFRRFAEASRQGFGMANMDGFFTYMNPAACRMVGVAKPEDVIGKHLTTCYPEGYMLRRETEILPALLQEGHWEGELVFSSAGKTTYILQNSFLIKDEDGNPSRIASVTTDITERKRVEEELQNANRKLVATLASITDGLVSFDHQWRYTYVNEAAARSLHTSPDKLLGKVPWEAWPEAVWAKRYAEFHRAVRENVSVHFEDYYPEPLNRWYECHAYPSSEGMALYFRDVTDRRYVEDALRRIEERFRVAFEEAPVGMMIAVGDGIITRVNHALCSVTGYTPEELTGSDMCELTHPEDRERCVPPVRKLLAGKLPSVTLESRYLGKGGRVLWARTTTAAVHVPSGGMVFAFGIVEDITARKQAQQALERERQTLWHMLQASDHERQTISYDIHDGLAQYLAAANMQLQVFDGLRESDPEEAKKAYDAATQLVRQAHAESRRLISEVRPPVIDEIGLETAISHLVHEQRQRGGPKIKFNSDVQFGRLPPILENAIYRIVQEALTNACKHSKSKKAMVTMGQEGQDVRLEVQDWGVGFNPESVGKGHFGLEGIRQRARLLGGRLTIESTPGSGTLVQLVVPIVEKPIEE